MPRPTTTLQRRAQIVASLKIVMANRGYEGASVQAIAKQAGLAPGLVHYHFKSKQEILLELVRNLGDTLEARIDSIDSAEPAERLAAMIDTWLATGSEGEDREAVACWVTIGAESLRQPEVRELQRRYVSRAVDDFEREIRMTLEAGGREVGRAPELAAAILAAIEGYFRLAAIAPERIPPGSAASAVKTMVRGWLEAQEAVGA